MEPETITTFCKGNKIDHIYFYYKDNTIKNMRVSFDAIYGQSQDMINYFNHGYYETSWNKEQIDNPGNLLEYGENYNEGLTDIYLRFEKGTISTKNCANIKTRQCNLDIRRVRIYSRYTQAHPMRSYINIMGLEFHENHNTLLLEASLSYNKEDQEKVKNALLKLKQEINFLKIRLS